MKLLKIDIDGFGVFVTIASLLLGVLTWWLSKLLTDKKEITVLQLKVEHLEEKVNHLEDKLSDYIGGEWRDARKKK